MKKAKCGNFRNQFGQDLTRFGALKSERSKLRRYVFYLDGEAANELREVGQIWLSGGEHEFIAREPQDHAVFYDEASIVAPQRVLGLAIATLPNIASHDAGQITFGVDARNAVFVQRGGVNKAGSIAYGEVLELFRHLILAGGQVTRPMAPQMGLVEGPEPVVKRGGLYDAGVEGVVHRHISTVVRYWTRAQ